VKPANGYALGMALTGSDLSVRRFVVVAHVGCHPAGSLSTAKRLRQTVVFKWSLVISCLSGCFS
jgi:hypothetical protein